MLWNLILLCCSISGWGFFFSWRETVNYSTKWNKRSRNVLSSKHWQRTNRYSVNKTLHVQHLSACHCFCKLTWNKAKHLTVCPGNINNITLRRPVMSQSRSSAGARTRTYLYCNGNFHAVKKVGIFARIALNFIDWRKCRAPSRCLSQSEVSWRQAAHWRWRRSCIRGAESWSACPTRTAPPGGTSQCRSLTTVWC